jgi:hypothetical protein
MLFRPSLPLFMQKQIILTMMSKKDASKSQKIAILTLAPTPIVYRKIHINKDSLRSVI